MQLFTPENSRPIHFMGIAGAGMSALALLARHRGVGVTGCDIDAGDRDRLESAGIRLLVGHDPAHVRGSRAVIFSSAIPREHPEIQAAVGAGIPVLKRAEALQSVVEHGRVIGVAGTHGKTTTTVMLTEALIGAGLDPTGIAGGRVDAWGGNARPGGDELFVVEADEYDRSFLNLEPAIAVINNIEPDHLECYGSFDRLVDAFAEYASRAKTVVANTDDRTVANLLARVGEKEWAEVVTVGMSEGCDIRISRIDENPAGTRADLLLPGGMMLEVELPVPGRHNLRNAAVALAAVYALGLDLHLAAAALKGFPGVGRRFELVGNAGGITVIDDYAHHPTEVVATLAAARQRFPRERLVTVFQPHLYTRTQRFASEFGIALAASDLAVVTGIYPAREKPIPGVTGELVVQAARRAGADVEWIPELEELAKRLPGMVGRGDAVLTLGAGNITEVGRKLIRDLERGTR